MFNDQLTDDRSSDPDTAGTPQLHFSKLRGHWVVDPKDGMGLGEVDDCFVDHTTGELQYLRIETGGILGIGKTYGLVPTEAIVGFDGDRILVDPARLVGATSYLEGRQPRWDIPRRTTVLCADGEEIGTVTEVHPGFIVAERGVYFPDDFYIPNDAIAIYDGHHVWLRLAKDDVLKHEWNSAPPLLVRADQIH